MALWHQASSRYRWNSHETLQNEENWEPPVQSISKEKRSLTCGGGYRDIQKQKPWEENTLVLVFSSSKGLSALACAVAHSRGYFSSDAPVAQYWPEFAQNGKEHITIRQLLAHEAGLAVIEEPLTLDILAHPDELAKILARQRPLWEPGTRHGYHAFSLGWYESEL